MRKLETHLRFCQAGILVRANCNPLQTELAIELCRAVGVWYSACVQDELLTRKTKGIRKSTPAHTPTPWHLIPAEATSTDYDYTILDAENNPIADIPVESSPENGRFIVRACNSHAALMAALGSLIGELDPSELDYDGRGAFYEARAVLAAAKE